MSPKNSIGGAVLCSPRVPRSATTKAQNKTKPIRKFLIMLVKQRHVFPANFFQELASHSVGEARVRRLNDQEKCVIRHPPECFIIKNRVVQSWQAIHDENTKECGKRREQHRYFKHDREKRA